MPWPCDHGCCEETATSLATSPASRGPQSYGTPQQREVEYQAPTQGPGTLGDVATSRTEAEKIKVSLEHLVAPEKKNLKENNAKPPHVQ